METRTFIRAGASAALLLIGAQAGATNLIQDGGFELNPACTNTFATTSSLGAWTVTGNVDLICKYWTPKEGAQSIDLNGNTPGTISQTFATMPGAEYQLEIWYSGNPDRAGTRTADVDVYPTDLPGYSLSWTQSTAGNTRSDMKWKLDSKTFIANGTSTTLDIMGYGETGCCWGIALDDISVSLLGFPVDIDVKPGSDPNCFNINDHGIIPVAIFGNEYVDVSLIDQSTLSFGGLAVRARGKAPGCSQEDLNGDGHPDLVCKFVDDSSFWDPGEGSAELTGTLGGTPIFGSDSICVVPASE